MLRPRIPLAAGEDVARKVSPRAASAEPPTRLPLLRRGPVAGEREQRSVRRHVLLRHGEAPDAIPGANAVDRKRHDLPSLAEFNPAACRRRTLLIILEERPDRPRHVHAEGAARVAIDRRAMGFRERNLGDTHQAHILQILAGPGGGPRNPVPPVVPLPRHQVIRRTIPHLSALELFKQFGEPRLRIHLPHEIRRKARGVAVPVHVRGAVDVEERVDAARLLRRQPIRDCLRLRIDEIHIIAVVVMRRTVLALVAVNRTVKIHERHGEQLDVLAQPAAEIIIGEEGRRHPLYDKRPHRLRTVVAGAREHPVARGLRNASESRPRNIASLAALCQRVGHKPPPGDHAMRHEEILPVLRTVWFIGVEPDLARAGREGIGERTARGVHRRRVGKGFPSVERHARPA